MSAYHLMHSKPKLLWILSTILPIMLVPFWYYEAYHKVSAFFWLKFFSVLIPFNWLQTCRYTSLRHAERLVTYSFGGLLILNIFEATALDFVHGHLPNAISGVLLILTMLPWIDKISIEDNNEMALKWSMPDLFLWGFSFFIWDLTVVWNNSPNATGVHLMVLILPLIIEKLYPGEWLQARGYTFYIGALGITVMTEIYETYFYVPHWLFMKDVYLLECISLAWMIAYTLRQLYVYRAVLKPSTLPPTIQQAA